jgi:cytochrome c oxidase cbb3-type subunit I/II
VAIAVVWVVFAVNFFWTLARRREKHLYVAVWFYIATIITVAVLHIVNSLAVPAGPLKSYSVFGGAQDALVQWWYGHNAVAFFLTTPVLGIMYYFLPKAAERPVYSYRLSIIHFWALIFVYIWAGPHHLLYTALPDWAQTLGMVFSVMLWAPSWGGMLNGLLTLRGAWGKLRSDPVIKFFVAGVTFYGMATFEGPLLSVKSVSGLAHYTDWIVGHVHSGALGWNGFMAAGMFYWMVPRLFGTQLWSKKLADAHFWVGTLGILLYVVAMWVSGVQQGLMWRALDPDGALTYSTFLQTMVRIKPMYWLRLVGGLLYFVGMIIMVWNLWQTVRQGKAVDGETVAPPLPKEPEVPWRRLVFGAPMLLVVAVTGLVLVSGALDEIGATGVVVIAAFLAIFVTVGMRLTRREGEGPWHRMLEGRPLLFTVFTLIAILIGGVAEILPSVLIREASPEALETKTYTALELEGRDVYLREGCYTCHSQMIRPLRFETLRYGPRSHVADSVFDHPFQWGSKRTGPDLARVGGKYPHEWHYQHMVLPDSLSPGSNMPPYAFLAERRVDFERTPRKLAVMRSVGVPYAEEDIKYAAKDAREQGSQIAAHLASVGITAWPDSEMVALIAYLQCLGTKAPPPAETAPLPEPATAEAR